MNKLNNLIHIGKKISSHGRWQLVFLRKVSTHAYKWFEEEKEGSEKDTQIEASSMEEAIRIAYINWPEEDFSLINCGFRYMLPERDEHGINALFYQMVSSYSSLTGVYFDEILGNNCFVQNASSEARVLWKKLAEQSYGT
jgi:hypothetical protein